MTTHQLIEALAARSGLTKRQAERAITAFTDIVTDNMVKGDKTALVGFGMFHRGTRGARHGVDPQTGADIHVPEMATPLFRAGSGLKAAIRTTDKARINA